jgi:hypothetical protein
VVAFLVTVWWTVELTASGQQCAGRTNDPARVNDVLAWGSVALVGCGVLLLVVLLVLRLRRAARSPAWWVVGGTAVCTGGAAGGYLRVLSECLMRS